MVATSDCAEKPKPGNKVSKPLMEKKRRARINQCLDQLKTLLESYYTTSIRKRKLEKADILELTVKHLRNLQKIQNSAPELSDYQTGFRNCLSNVNHYLVMSDSLSGTDHWMLSQLSNKLSRSRRRGGLSSTMDSPGRLGPEQAEPPRAEGVRLPPSTAGPQDATMAEFTPLKSQSVTTSPVSRQASGAKQAALCTVPARHTREKRSSKTFDRTGVVNTQQSVWRPW